MKRVIILILANCLLCACAGSKKYEGDSSWLGFTEQGKASYYATEYQSRKTASGERLDNNALTAAHKRLPFGTKVRVTNVRNGKHVEVIINDRGPFVKGRVIDLTRAAFSQIEVLNRGIAEVEISVIQ